MDRINVIGVAHLLQHGNDWYCFQDHLHSGSINAGGHVCTVTV